MGHGDGTQDKGLHRRIAGLKLVRLDSARAATPSNLVLMREEEAAELLEIGLQHWKNKYPQVSRFVHTTLETVKGIYGEFS